MIRPELVRPARLLPPPAVPGQPQAPPGAILPPLPPNAHHIVHPAPPGGGGGPPTAIALPGIAAPHSLQDGVDNKLIVSVVPAPPAGLNSNQEVLAPKSKQGIKNVLVKCQIKTNPFHLFNSMLLSEFRANY